MEALLLEDVVRDDQNEVEHAVLEQPEGPPSGGSSSYEVIGPEDLQQSILPFSGTAPFGTTSVEQPGTIYQAHTSDYLSGYVSTRFDTFPPTHRGRSG